MKAIFAEIGKVCRSRLFLSMLLCLLGVNLYCLWDTANSGAYSPAEYRRAWDEIMAQPAGGRVGPGPYRNGLLPGELYRGTGNATA